MTTPSSLLSPDADPPIPPHRRTRLWRRIQTIVFIVFCLEMGLVLLLLPWSELWSHNYFFSLAPNWSELFGSSYLRGAISGIGLINVWIALSEAWRLRSL